MTYRKRLITIILVTTCGLVYWLFSSQKSVSEDTEITYSHEIQTSMSNDINTAIKHTHKEKGVNTITQPKADAPHPTGIQPLTIPPINNTRSAATYQGDLDDHEAYLEWQSKQEVKLKQAFIKAAKTKVTELEKLLKRGIEEGIDEAQIEFAKDKINGLKKQSEALEVEIKKAS